MRRFILVVLIENISLTKQNIVIKMTAHDRTFITPNVSRGAVKFKKN